MALSSTLDPGAFAGKYSILREIGRGGMGVVYLAEDTTLAREVALKVLFPSLSGDSIFIARFKQEARVVASIIHPNIVRINSFETLGQCLAIDMEYVPGPSLGHAMARSVFTPQLAIQIARDALEGLAVCHELGVVHRDIKPNNILLSPDGRAKLADFGLATAYASHLESSVYQVSSSGFFLGTPRFAPPEAWEGTHPLPDWDLYSLGLVLYEGLTGKPAYDGNSPLAIVKQLMSRPLAPVRELVPEISLEMGQLINRLISHNHSNRPQDASVALAELRALPEFGLTVNSDSPTVRTAIRSVQRKAASARWMNRSRKAVHRGLSAAAVIAAVCVVAWFAVVTRANRESNAPLPNPSHPIVSQEELVQSNLLTVKDVLSHPKSNATKLARIFDARYFKEDGKKVLEQGGVDHTERWLVTPLPDGKTHRIIGISERFILVGELLDTKSGTVTMKGNWAAYALAFGAGFQDGTVEGKGTWMLPGKALNLLLRLDNSRDHSVQSFSVAAAHDENRAFDSNFAYELESAPLLQPLIFVELMYRHADWIGPVHDLLPSVTGSTCIVPLLSDTVPSPPMDGVLDDEVWTRKYFGKHGNIGAIPGRPKLSGAEMRARVTSSELIIGLSSPRPASKRWGVHVMLMPILPGPLNAQASMRVSRYAGGQTEYHYYQGEIERAWENFDWKMEVFGDPNGMSCGVAIPLNSLEEPAKPAKEVVWRLNAWIVEGDSSVQETTVAAWGFPDPKSVEHGALLRFESQSSQ